jgi:hypothetical protein
MVVRCTSNLGARDRTDRPPAHPSAAISNQRETFVPPDAARHAVRPAIVRLDERCQREVEPFARNREASALGGQWPQRR